MNVKRRMVVLGTACTLAMPGQVLAGKAEDQAEVKKAAQGALAAVYKVQPAAKKAVESAAGYGAYGCTNSRTRGSRSSSRPRARSTTRRTRRTERRRQRQEGNTAWRPQPGPPSRLNQGRPTASSTSAGYTAYAVLGLVGSYPGIYFYLRMVQNLFMDAEAASANRATPGRLALGAGLICLAAGLVMSVAPGRVLGGL